MDKARLISRLRTLWQTDIRPFLILALILFSLRSSLADWNDVPTGSMKPTILEGDRVWVNKLAYDLKVPFTTWHLAEWGAPRRGDIAVFYSPYDGKRLVKRVVGLPGDQLEMRDNRLLLNGEALSYAALPFESLRGVSANDLERYRYASEDLAGRQHAVASQPSLSAPRTWGPFTVPEGQYFMMGDNRDESFDSRFWGVVPRKQIIGRASSVVISLDRANGWSPRWDRFFTNMGS